MCVRRAKFRVAVVTLATARGPVRSEGKSLTSERARGPVPAEVMIGLSGDAAIGRLGNVFRGAVRAVPAAPAARPVPFAWWIRLPRRLWATIVAQNRHQSRIHRNNFRFVESMSGSCGGWGDSSSGWPSRAPRCLTRSCRCTARAKETRQPSPPGPRSSRFFCVRLPLRRPATVLPGRPDYSGVVCGLRLTNQPVAYACRFAFSTPPNAGCLDRQAMLPVGVCLVHAPMALPGGHGPRCVSPPALRGPVNRLSRRSSGIGIRRAPDSTTRAARRAAATASAEPRAGVAPQPSAGLGSDAAVRRGSRSPQP